MAKKEQWLPGLITPDAQSGYDLEIQLSRMAVKLTQPNDDVRSTLRETYETDATALIHASHVVALHFATIARANDHWRQP